GRLPIVWGGRPAGPHRLSARARPRAPALRGVAAPQGPAGRDRAAGPGGAVPPGDRPPAVPQPVHPRIPPGPGLHPPRDPPASTTPTTPARRHLRQARPVSGWARPTA